MSEIILNCPQCQRLLRVTQDLVGRPVKCPVCGLIFSVPAGGNAPQPVPPDPDEMHAPSPDQFPAPAYNEANLDEEVEERPWEEQGRRDAEPHRGNLVLALGIVSIVMSGLVFCSFGLTGLVGLPLGIAAWLMGRRDLRKMRENLMDREGNGLTQAGVICGIVGTVLGSLGVLCFLVYLAFAFTLPVLRNIPRKPAPRPVPVPLRPALPPPGPRQPGNRAVLHEMPERLQDEPAALA